ncbi:MAG: hypothetical protein AAGA64_12990, partial [Bacteroidota bacterium]
MCQLILRFTELIFFKFGMKNYDVTVLDASRASGATIVSSVKASRGLLRTVSRTSSGANANSTFGPP